MTALTPAGAGEPLTRTAPAPPAPDLLQAAMDGAGEAMVLCATAGDLVLLANAEARRLLPGIQPGQDVTAGLIGGFAGSGDSFRAEHNGRRLYGMRRRLNDGHYAWYVRDHTTESVRAAALEVERSRTAFLAEAGRRLAASLHVRRCARTTAELAVSHLADAAIVVLPAGSGQCSWIRLSPGHAPQEGTLAGRMLAEVPGLAEAIDGFPPIPSRWLDPALAPGWLFPAGLGPIGSLLVTPLPGNAEPAGALILARTGTQGTFSADDEALARVFAARAGAAIAAAMLYQEQVDTTAVLQADLLPPELPGYDGFELAAAYQAARDSLRIGGDFYDVLAPTAGGTDTMIALGDVCGTGPEAAVLTGKVRHTLRALRLAGVAPEAMLPVLNEALLQSGRRQRFVTLVVGSVHRVRHGRVWLRLASGGHPPPLVLRNDGTVEVVPVKGTLIGVLPRTTVSPATVELAPGELCLLYSDGLTEARGGPGGAEQFGEERLRRHLASCRGIPGTVAVERLRQVVSDWVHGGPRDDIAMMAVRAHTRPPRGGGAPNAASYLAAAGHGGRPSRSWS